MFTKDEIELLQASLKCYLEHGVKESFMNSVMVAAMGRSLGIEQKSPAELAQEAIDSANDLKDRVVLLQSKLIQLKDKIEVSNFIEDL